MKKGLIVTALMALLFNAGYSQKLSKDETKRIKEELKNYTKHPETYKAKVEQAQADKDSAEAQISRLKTDLATSQSNESDLQKKLALADEQTKQLQEDAEKMKEVVAKAKDADLAKAPAQGTVYKVQLGMYKGFNINKYFEQPRYIGYEEVDGMNRYVISYFPDQETALKFVADIRKIGVRDAFVAKYIDGTRVFEWSENPKYKGKKVPDSLEDALSGNKPAKKTAHHVKQQPAQ